MNVDRTHGWDRQAAIRKALARLERLPDVGPWSHDTPAKRDDRDGSSAADRASCCR